MSAAPGHRSSAGGAAAAPRDFLPFHRPSITEADVQAVANSVRAGWLTHGPECQAFEREFAAATGSARAVSVASGTAAMHLSLVALDLPPGAEVITTPMTFCSSAHVIEHAGATPVFVDVDPETLQIDPEGVEAAMSVRTGAILPVDFGGHPCPIAQINRTADAAGVPVVVDAAHSLGASVDGRPVGSLATVTCFSFYATKNITTGEGGMATTGDGRLADRLERLRLHGISRDAWNRYRQGGTWYYEVAEAGFKANLTDPQAALGRSQLAREPSMRGRRAAIAQAYTAAFAELPDLLEPPWVAEGVTPAWHLYPLRLRTEALAIGRNAFIEDLGRSGIGTSVHFIPLHLQPYFRQRFGFGSGAFPVAEDAYRRLVSLPIYPDLTDDEVAFVAGRVADVARSHAR